MECSRRLYTYQIPAVVMLVTLCGCGGDGRLPTFPVQGHVIVDDRPAAGVELRFHHQSKSTEFRPPFAVSDSTGHFHVTTYAGHDGVPEGKYMITASWRRPVGPIDSTLLPDELTAAAFGELFPERLDGMYLSPSSTPLTATITKETDAHGLLEFKLRSQE